MCRRHSCRVPSTMRPKFRAPPRSHMAWSSSPRPSCGCTVSVAAQAVKPSCADCAHGARRFHDRTTHSRHRRSNPCRRPRCVKRATPPRNTPPLWQDRKMPHKAKSALVLAECTAALPHCAGGALGIPQHQHQHRTAKRVQQQPRQKFAAPAQAVHAGTALAHGQVSHNVPQRGTRCIPRRRARHSRLVVLSSRGGRLRDMVWRASQTADPLHRRGNGVSESSTRPVGQ